MQQKKNNMRLAFVISHNGAVVAKFYENPPKINQKKIWRIRKKYYIMFRHRKKSVTKSATLVVISLFL